MPGSLKRPSFRHLTTHALIFASLLSSCVTSGPYAESLTLSKKGSCEEAAERTQISSFDSFLDSSKRAVGTTTSYAGTALGYTADTLIIVVGGVALITVACLPAFAAQAAAHSSTVTAQCFLPDAAGELIALPEIGHSTRESTASWRESQDEATAKALLAVGTCYERRGDERNLAKAHAQFEQLKALSTAPANIKSEAEDSRQRVEHKLKALDSAYMKRLTAARAERDATRQRIIQDITRTLKSNKARTAEWLQFKRGLRWRIAEVPISDTHLARLGCQALSINHESWDVPTRGQFEQALEDGLLARETNKAFRPFLGDKLAFWVSNEDTPLYDMNNGEFVKVTEKNMSRKLLICVQ